MTENREVVRVSGLTVRFGQTVVVDSVSLSVAAGECLAIVGESGSGKTLTARALLGLLPDGASVDVDELVIDGVDARSNSERDWRHLRGARVGLVSQDALVSLDPLRRVGAEVAEVIEIHGAPGSGERMPRAGIADTVTGLLARVAVPEPADRARQYPHELSGGLRQRALIASALAGEPGILIADEPTTALDVTVQAQVLDLLSRLRAAGLGIIMISHDLAVVAGVADRVAVMKDGRIVEEGTTTEVLSNPQHPYTQMLLAAAPRLGDGPFADRVAARRRSPSIEITPGGLDTAARGPLDQRESAPLLHATGLGRDFRRHDGSLRSAVDDVSLTVHAGASIGVVGESGSGKTTLARLLLGFDDPDRGSVSLDGRDWSGVSERRRRSRRGEIQLISQDPLGSFDPRYTVARIVAEGLRGDARRRSSEKPAARIRQLLESVGLDVSLEGRRPHELSGGQRQRVAIARALASEPRILVCDEPVSALDVSIQATIIDLLDALRRDLGVALVFVSHDLAVVAQLCDEVLVMRDGRVLERGATDHVFRHPEHPFTRALVAAVPRMPSSDRHHAPDEPSR
ncbi:dipeptide ABC transporter ATP-binding protein [Agreia pratensis]|uniref:Peptide/nickel transport system ATP-binding protein n=1 Tax=Agreia pratensis TaxID=150121 RepID=A0A1X7L1D3_9MICO|nr:ABC transporter ATP-binding protein [Agreia pratensis]SMG47324.1 peptide/nickel transport system ATP-binding protein [Agreia pratensis]